MPCIARLARSHGWKRLLQHCLHNENSLKRFPYLLQRWVSYSIFWRISVDWGFTEADKDQQQLTSARKHLSVFSLQNGLSIREDFSMKSCTFWSDLWNRNKRTLLPTIEEANAVFALLPSWDLCSIFFRIFQKTHWRLGHSCLYKDWSAKAGETSQGGRYWTARPGKWSFFSTHLGCPRAKETCDQSQTTRSRKKLLLSWQSVGKRPICSGKQILQTPCVYKNKWCSQTFWKCYTASFSWIALRDWLRDRWPCVRLTCFKLSNAELSNEIRKALVRLKTFQKQVKSWITHEHPSKHF